MPFGCWQDLDTAVARQWSIAAARTAPVRPWKVELQKLADATRLTIKVRHYPPGTSKWNKIEHRLFGRITQNWRGRPLTDRAAVVELNAAATAKTGRKVENVLDTRSTRRASGSPTPKMKALNIRGDGFHPEWNYSVIRRSKS